jgi:hypothetical protein
MIRHRATGASGALLALAFCGCAGSVQVRILAPGEDCARDFGSSTAAAKIETFLAASVALGREADAANVALTAACVEGLREAGVVTEPTPERPCEALGAWVTAESAALASAPRLSDATPTCSPQHDDLAACVSRCELRYRPDDVQVVTDEAGLLTAPQASPRCRASCETLHAIAETCSSPVALVEGSSEADPSRVARLRAVLVHVAYAAELGARAERVSRAARRLVAIAPVLPEAAATISIRAVACVSAASTEVRGAAERLEAVAGSARSARGSEPASNEMPRTPQVTSLNSFDGGGGRG